MEIIGKFLCFIGIHNYKDKYRLKSEKELAGWGSLFCKFEHVETKCNRCNKVIVYESLFSDYD